jgi:hypothetical protein
MVGLWYGESCDKPARIGESSVVVAQVGGRFVGSEREGVQVGMFESEFLHGRYQCRKLAFSYSDRQSESSTGVMGAFCVLDSLVNGKTGFLRQIKK